MIRRTQYESNAIYYPFFKTKSNFFHCTLFIFVEYLLVLDQHPEVDQNNFEVVFDISDQKSDKTEWEWDRIDDLDMCDQLFIDPTIAT